MAAASKSAVPDVLAPDLDVVFVGINPGFHSDAKAAHFANPRNDFWRLLHAAGFTPRLLDPSEQFDALAYGVGITNAAERTTRGSSDLRKPDFAGSAARLKRLAVELAPRAIGFVGKEAYRGPFGGRPQHGLQESGWPRRCSSSSRRRRRPTPRCHGTSGCTGSARSASSSRERPPHPTLIEPTRRLKQALLLRGRPDRQAFATAAAWRSRQVPLSAPVSVHDVDVGVAVALGDERDLSPVR